MPLFKDLPATLTGRIRTQDDFTFQKLKEELAVKIRSEYFPRFPDSLEGPQLTFDDDGDIKISTKQGTGYVTRHYISFTTFADKTALIADGPTVPLISTVLSELLNARSPLLAEEYVLRLFLRVPNVALKSKELESYFPKSLSKISGDVAPDNLILDWSADWAESQFYNKFEFRAIEDQVTVVFTEKCPAEKVPSFQEFVRAADIVSLLARIERFLEPLIADR